MNLRTTIEFNTSGTCDLNEDVPMSFTYSIADIREPDKRNKDYSKTITLPGTKKNNQLFAYIFDISADRLFNPNKTTPVRIFIDGTNIFTGVLRLLNIKVLDIQDDSRVEYECSVMGRLSNIFTNIGDNELRDLDLSAFDHVYNQTSQSTSWTGALGSGYVYPLIDYGYSFDDVNYNVNELFPAIYVKTYIDEIFKAAGFVYNSSLFISTAFKRLIIPFNSEAFKLTGSTITNRKFLASRETTDQDITFTAGVGYNTDTIQINDDSTSPNFDNSNQFNTATNIFTAGNPGWYDFSSTIKWTFNVTTTGNICYEVNYYFEKTDAITSAITILGLKQIYNNCFTPTSTGEHIGYNGTGTPPTVTSQTDTISISQIYLKSGDKIKLRVRHLRGAFALPTAYTLRIKKTTTTFSNNITKTNVADGDTCLINTCIPDKIKQKDFLKSIITMFNLYLDTDRDNDNKLNIETRDTFYNSTVLDWSAKLDLEKQIEIEPIGALDARQYMFTYKEDSDYWNKKYKDNWGRIYGDRIIDIDNDFLTNTKKTEIIFSPTPSIGSLANNRVIPRIYQSDTNNNVTPKISNLRILTYGGLIAGTSWNHVSTSSGVTTLNTTYPYAGHLDSPTAPTSDLCFGIPKQVFWNTTIYTNGNLYNNYYKKFINEITDVNSSIVKTWMYLTPTDIAELDFRKIYYFDNQNFRLNKIIDYNPISEDSVQCEFIKIKDSTTFTSATSVVSGAANINPTTS